jgi:hypothetical protein
VQGTAQFHHQIADTLFPQADPVFDDATALDATVDMLDPQPTLVQGLIGPLLFPGEFLAAWFLPHSIAFSGVAVNPCRLP